MCEELLDADEDVPPAAPWGEEKKGKLGNPGELLFGAEDDDDVLEQLLPGIQGIPPMLLEKFPVVDCVSASMPPVRSNTAPQESATVTAMQKRRDGASCVRMELEWMLSPV